MLVLGAGLVVNGILKDDFGRARPRDIEAFGGSSQFTPAFVVSHECDRNCSFSSGDGAGAFVEYETGGTYHVTTSCDVGQGGDCYWDIVVTPLGDAALLSVSPFDLESDDSVVLGSGNQLRMVAKTGKDLDGFSFQTEPGAAIELDVLLDDGPGNRYLFWVGDGALHSGAPSNPIDLVPSAE